MKRNAKFRSLGFGVLTLSCFVYAACGDQTDEPGDTSGEKTKPGGIGSGVASENSDSKGESSEAGGPDNPLETPEPELENIRIEPEELLVRLDLGEEKSVDFKAIGIFDDEKERDITDKVDWKLDDEEVGKLDEETLSVFSHKEFSVGTTAVIARYQNRIGVAQVTVAAYQKSGATPDFLFVLPYQDKKGAQDSNLVFSTVVPALDVFFDVDTTQSMKDEIEELRRSLQKEIVPQIQDKIEKSQFGVGAFDDFPVRPYGQAKGLAKRADQPFTLKQSITDNIAAVQKGVDGLSLGRGGDIPESALESLYQIATGEGLQGPKTTMVPANKKGIGGVGFRKGTMPVIVTITDAVSHAPGETKDGCDRDYAGEVAAVAHTRKQTEDALEKVCARVIYVGSEGGSKDPNCTPEFDGKALAKATGSRVFPAVWDKNRPANCLPGQCCTGIGGRGKAPEADGRCSLVYNVNSKGQGLGSTIVSGIKALAFYAQFDVTVDQEGKRKSVDGKIELPGQHTTLDFISKITADKFGNPPLKGLPNPKPSGDHFKDVTPGTEVQFKIEALNDFLPEVEGEVQVFKAKIKVKADQCEGLELDTRDIHFIVPPAPLAPPV